MSTMMVVIALMVSLVSVGVLSCAHLSQPQGGDGSDTRTPKKLSSFNFLESCEAMTTDQTLSAVRNELKAKGTVIDLMKFYADELQKDVSTESPYFAKLQKIFDCGVTPEAMEGYYHGAVVAFRNEAYLNIFNLNTLNLGWPLVRLFSPWRGKTFEPISPEKLSDVTEGRESGKVPAAWGSNTYSSRGFRERMALAAMKGVGIRVEPATADEIPTRDYDVKGFFFIGKVGKSINPANSGRTVYQFNYRWHRLETFPPDNYCMDEVVKIAEGLYLGQLVYATDLKRKYDPDSDPAFYRYRNFGYFLLMDDEWHARRIKIGYDIQGSGQ